MLKKIFNPKLNFILENKRLIISPLKISHIEKLIPMCLNINIWKYNININVKTEEDFI